MGRYGLRGMQGAVAAEPARRVWARSAGIIGVHAIRWPMPVSLGNPPNAIGMATSNRPLARRIGNLAAQQLRDMFEQGWGEASN